MLFQIVGLVTPSSSLLVISELTNATVVEEVITSPLASVNTQL